ncbi:mitochondrial fission 1 protein isoform X2 [Episyrphus balteatus]|uniref:mitochondrial fission 1 protein isoform X2 n=2 Tax=Episyrphus balteatus TaxID=286459 RepID=UPI00248691CA|nr:mitochondrial fission 1 protein isoform X2 [Episyrphus balteatus]
MEELLNDIVSAAELEKFEKKYTEAENASNENTFEYAFCLVRSAYTNDIRKGIHLLEQLANSDPGNKRDYIYYLALGNTRIKQYIEGMNYCKAFLEIEPNNEQVLSLKKYIKEQQDKDMMKGVAVAGGAALVLGGLVGLGVALAKKRTTHDKQ